MDNIFLKLVVFVPPVLAVYHLLPRRLRNGWLLLASYGFYATWTWHFPVILFLLTLLNFGLARALQPGEKPGSRLVLWAGIGANILALASLKYGNALFPGLGNALASGTAAPLFPLRLDPQTGISQILLPVGLSFVVLQNISYLIDVYRRQVQATPDLVAFALYLAYFPKLLSGPIERARSFLPRLAEPRMVDGESVARSLTLIVVGVTRKLLLADPLRSMIPARAFEEPGAYAALQLMVWVLAYCFSLYNDFAGYTNMVRGVSGLFGIELSPNFQQPFFARNFTELWGRWHMSLSQWLRDYIFFPISRALLRRFPKRRNLLNLLLPPLVTMLVSALWHGASWHMLLWGTLQGLYLVLDRLPTLWRPVVPPDRQPVWRQVAGMVVVSVLFALSLVPFRTGVGESVAYWRALLSFTFGLPDGRVLLLMGVTLLVDGIQYRQRDETVFLRWPRPVRAFALAFIVMVVTFIATQSAVTMPPFVYQGF